MGSKRTLLTFHLTGLLPTSDSARRDIWLFLSPLFSSHLLCLLLFLHSPVFSQSGSGVTWQAPGTLFPAANGLCFHFLNSDLRSNSEHSPPPYAPPSPPRLRCIPRFLFEKVQSLVSLSTRLELCMHTRSRNGVGAICLLKCIRKTQ